MPAQNLGLNEALLSVKAINISSPIEVYHQIDECFGCPLTRLTPLLSGEEFSQESQFIVSTKHNVQLEIRQVGTKNSSSTWCGLGDVAFNSHGQYQIDVIPNSHPAGGAHQTLDCIFKTIDLGECLFCPFAILICILIAIVAIEQIYRSVWLERHSPSCASARYGHTDRKLSSPDSMMQSGSDAESAAENGNHGDLQGPRNDEEGHDLDHVDDGRQQLPPVPNSQANQPRPTPLQSGGAHRADLSIRLGTPPRIRIECLDTFRGLTLVGMIFVNYGGAGYAIWEHKAWDGITLADFVFPFFIFSMGASISISTRNMIKRYEKSFHSIAFKILKRSVILALLGVCLNSKWINYEQADGLSNLRLTGVLQRFSISYLVIAFIYAIELTINKWICAQSLTSVPYLKKLTGTIFELLAAVNYLAIYVYMTFYFEFSSNCPKGYTGPGGMTEGGKYANCTGGAAAWLDRKILGTSHMYQDHEVQSIFKTRVSHDPEGLLGYITSILLTLIGLQCGKILIGSREDGTVANSHRQKLLAIGRWIVALALASSLVLVVPINKRLWSVTFVIVTAMAAFVIIALLYILLDVYSCKRSFLMKLLSSAGKNSILLYVGHSLIFGMLPWWFPVGDQTSHLQLLLRLAWSTFMWLLVAHYMALKGLFIRI